MQFQLTLRLRISPGDPVALIHHLLRIWREFFGGYLKLRTLVVAKPDGRVPGTGEPLALPRLCYENCIAPAFDVLDALCKCNG